MLNLQSVLKKKKSMRLPYFPTLLLLHDFTVQNLKLLKDI